jgi:hypothetical protein
MVVLLAAVVVDDDANLAPTASHHQVWQKKITQDSFTVTRPTRMRSHSASTNTTANSGYDAEHKQQNTSTNAKHQMMTIC